ncbi:uncharacterized protein LOC117513447 [Thalassophryne amazonica]|uniref:uncharacterized protein LOC117513447 n=1 Tax=Thalassophryne amazonica TaxID=390379 RepID=UPI001470911E|nr:uncharacterized protein LOC117513447 [Thalassophryne amazonica]
MAVSARVNRMSVTMAKTDGVTVFTVTSDPNSACPPLCQILKGLCYSPVCFSVSPHLRKAQQSAQSLLGALHIMVGSLNVAFGSVLLCSQESWWGLEDNWSPVWLGAVFITFGIMCILSEKFPSPCLVILNVILNLSGVGFAIAASILYSINIAVMGFWWSCEDDWYNLPRDVTATISPDGQMFLEKCNHGRLLTLWILRSINAVLIILSALELCLTISSAVLAIKALKSKEDEQDMMMKNPEDYKPLLEEVTTNRTA